MLKDTNFLFFCFQEDEKGNKELKRLACYGAGPKMAGFEKQSLEEKKSRFKKSDIYYDPVSVVACCYIARVYFFTQ